MILKYSENSIPFIEFENGDRLAFSSLTKNDKGYKNLCFSGKTDAMSVSAGSKKPKKILNTFKIPISFITNMSFTKIPKLASKTSLTPMTRGFLKKMFSTMLDDEGYFPHMKLISLGERLQMLDIDDEIDDIKEDEEEE